MGRKRQVKEEEGLNFFVPMVDMMVSAIFIFIIIVMVLVLLINPPASMQSEQTQTEEEGASPASSGSVEVKPSAVAGMVANQTAEEVLVDDINREFLKEQGIESLFDPTSKKLEIKLIKPNAEEK